MIEGLFQPRIPYYYKKRICVFKDGLNLVYAWWPGTSGIVDIEVSLSSKFVIDPCCREKVCVMIISDSTA